MKRTFSLKENRDFQKTYRKGMHKSQKYLTVYVYKMPHSGQSNSIKGQGETSGSRLGITVGKKFGNSVQRNSFKRFVRETYRDAYGALNANYYVVVAAKPTQRSAANPNRKLKALKTPTRREVRQDILTALWSLGAIDTAIDV